MRMLAIDMDGTCLNDGHRISMKTLNALRQAAEAGIEIVPATGRALTCLPHQLRSEKYVRYVISSNGAVVTDLKQDCSIYNALIPNKTACELLNKLEKIGLGFTAHIDNYSVVEGKTLTVCGRLAYGIDASNTICVRSLTEYIQDRCADAEELQLFSFVPGARAQMTEVLKDYPDITVTSTVKCVELNLQEATKGMALAALANHLGIRQDHIACVGNGRNDLSMFQSSGMKFAVGNAVQELKNAADYTVPSNNKSGVAAVVQKYLL